MDVCIDSLDGAHPILRLFLYKKSVNRVNSRPILESVPMTDKEYDDAINGVAECRTAN